MTKADFKSLPDEEFSLEEQIKEIVYELALRESAYPRFIERGQLTPEQARRQAAQHEGHGNLSAIVAAMAAQIGEAR